MDMKRILQAMDGASSKPVEGVNSMAKFLRVVDEAAMYGAATTPPSPSGLTPAQQHALAPYLETDPSDGSKYYDLPATDTKEKGAIMGTTIKSPGYIAAIKQDQGKVIQQLLRQLDPKNQVKEPQVTTTPLSDEETAKVMADLQENSLDKFLSIVKKNDVVSLNEGANPHKVSLPVQMAMQHYQQPVVETPVTPTITRESSIKKYFSQAETDAAERLTQKNNLYKQYAQTIAERVMMKESKLDERSTTEKQARTMAAAAHNPEFAKKIGIKPSVAKEFNKKDKGTALLSNAMKGKKKVVNEFDFNRDRREESPLDNYPCYDCGSTIFHHHTKHCDLAEPNAVRDLPSKHHNTQHWNGHIPHGLHPIPGLNENEIPGHSMGFKPGPGGPGLQSNVAEAPLDFDRENPMSSTIHSHQGVNPASIEARIMRARRQLKDLAEQAQSDDPRIWQHITKLFPELAMNIEQISHGLGELGSKRRAGGVNSRNIPVGIDEMMNDPCWKGYKMVGTKKKGGKSVPNCVPKKGK